MLFSIPAVLALGAVSSVQGLAIDKRDDPEFSCKPGYQLTSYTTAGVGTCTKIEGSSILVGYSGQTVAYVGLASGLLTLLTVALPFARQYYKSGRGFFTKDKPQWQSAFPRGLIEIGEDSAINDLQGHLHSAWAEGHGRLQSRHLDPESTVVFETTENTTSATYNHGGYAHTHMFNVIPHNETHVTWDTSFDLAPIEKPLEVESSLAKRNAGWTGARYVLSNQPSESDAYNGVRLSENVIKELSDDLIARYLNAIVKGSSQLCAFIGSAPHRHKHFVFWLTITSQEDYGLYDITECLPFVDDVFPPDEL